VLWPLYVAARHGDADVPQLLLDGGADANKAKNDFNTTLLCIAARKGHREVIRVLLGSGDDRLRLHVTVRGG
jgi:ankyrin repeat protein